MNSAFLFFNVIPYGYAAQTQCPIPRRIILVLVPAHRFDCQSHNRNAYEDTSMEKRRDDAYVYHLASLFDCRANFGGPEAIYGLRIYIFRRINRRLLSHF